MYIVSRFRLFLLPIFTGRDPSIYTSNPVTAFESSTHYSSVIGTSMVVLGIVFTLFALRNYIYTYKSIEQGTYSPKHFEIYLLSMALVILGVFIVAYLVIIPLLIGQN